MNTQRGRLSDHLRGLVAPPDGPFPVPAALDSWNPPHCGESGISIAADGTWSHEGAPIARRALVQLFASILRRDAQEFVLVTPVEKLSLHVEDAPFAAVDMTMAGESIRLRTSLGDAVTVGPKHPLRFALDAHAGLVPYVLVRGALWARLTRSLAITLGERAEHRRIDGIETAGIPAGGHFYPVPAT